VTVQTEISRSGPYAGSGTTGPFTVGFRFLDATHLQVVRTSTGGIDTTLALSTDYSVTGAGGSSGAVTLVVALASGERLTIVRDVPFTQLADYVDNDAFPAESHEGALDLLTMQTQQNREGLGRALTLPVTAYGVSTELPAPESNKIIGWNSAATAMQNIDAGTLATMVAYGTSAGDMFSGNGVQTAFVLSANPGALYNLDVSIGGVDQRAVLDYTWSAGTTITFTTAPVAGTDNIQVKYKQALPQGFTDSSASTYTPSGTGAVATTVQDKLRQCVSVKDFGAKGDGVTDDAPAINLAYAAIPSTGGVLYFPQGVCAIGSALSFTNAKPLVIRGDGQFASQIKPTFTTGDAITVEGPSLFAFLDCGIVSAASRTTTTYLLHVKNCTRPVVTNGYFNATTGGLVMIEACNFVQMSQLQGDTGDGATLRIKSAGGNYSNIFFRGGAAQSCPPLWITGTSTSIKIANCVFTGGGPHSKWNITGIVSTALNFTVTTSSPHDFQAGDYLVIRGTTPTPYGNLWRIAAVTSTTVVVTSTINPGASTINGTAESLSACGYVSGEDGQVNESSITSTLFEALQANVYGSAGLYFDGRRGVALSKYGMQGWNLADLYLDYGASGLVLSGDKANAGLDPTVSGFTVSSPICSSNNRGILLDQVTGIVINNPICHGVSTIQGDALGGAVSQGIYIYAGPSQPYTQGVTINGGSVGMPRNWGQAAGGLAFSYTLALDGPNIQDLAVVGMTGFGLIGAVQEISGPLSSASRWKFKDCNFNFGTWPPANPNYIPSVASATNVNFYPYNTVQKITGTTNIQNIFPLHIGSEKTLIFTGALSLVTGGNLAIAATYNVLAGQAVNLVSDGTSWFVK